MTNEHNEELTALVKQVGEYDTELKYYEKQVSNVKKLLANLLEKEIPTKLHEMGLTEGTLEDGTVVSVKPMYFAKIKDENRERAYNWLRNNGLGDIIQRKLALNFTTGEDAAASAAKTLLEKEGHIVQDVEAVNFQTLGATVREQINAGNDIPRDLLGVYQKNEAKIRRTVT
jgi:hypothetical protein